MIRQPGDEDLELKPPLWGAWRAWAVVVALVAVVSTTAVTIIIVHFVTKFW